MKQHEKRMSFGLAIEAMKKGYKVARSGWNGKGMFIYIQNSTIVPITGLEPEPMKYLFGESLQECDVTVKICSHIDMKAADGSLVVGWLASQTDMLSDDWGIVE